MTTGTEKAGYTNPPRYMEQSILGAMMHKAGVIPEAVRLLDEHDFYGDAERSGWQSITALFASGRPIDPATVADDLARRGGWNVADAYRAACGWWDASGVAGWAEMAYHAGVVKNHSRLRRLHALGAVLQRDALSPHGSAEDMAEEAQKELLALLGGGPRGARPLREALAEADDALARRKAAGGGLDGLSTGLRSLDEKLHGLRGSEMLVLAARPSVGKSALGLQIAAHAAIDLGVPALFVSLEQPMVQLGERLLCACGRVDSLLFRTATLTDADYNRLRAVAPQMRPAPLFIDDRSRRMLHIGAEARRLRASPGIGLVVVDYLQLIEPEDRKANRTEQVGGVARRLQELSRELAVPVVVLAQLNRDVEKRLEGRPQLSDLRDSGEIEQHADVVMLMWRPKVDDPPPAPYVVTSVDVAKNRNGPTGVCALYFHGPHMRFDDLDPAVIRSPFRNGES